MSSPVPQAVLQDPLESTTTKSVRDPPAGGGDRTAVPGHCCRFKAASVVRSSPIELSLALLLQAGVADAEAAVKLQVGFDHGRALLRGEVGGRPP